MALNWTLNISRFLSLIELEDCSMYFVPYADEKKTDISKRSFCPCFVDMFRNIYSPHKLFNSKFLINEVLVLSGCFSFQNLAPKLEGVLFVGCSIPNTATL